MSIDVNLVVPEQFRVIAPTGTSPYQRYIDAYQRGYFAVLRQWLDEPSTDPGQLGHHLEMLGWEAAIEGHGAGIAAARAQLKTQLQRHDPSAVRAYVAELMAEK